ncbi:MAG: protein kinase [Deltaproteobacteria bacterium]|nr:protein kinase [Deltaproteobacteria bacterium]
MPIVLLTEEERLGTTVGGRYRLDSVLGAGGMAVVFQARHTWTGRDVAVKFLDPRRTKDVVLAARRFLKEGRVIGALKHPNIVQVLDMGRDEHGIVFQVLELLKGHTLAARLDEDGRLTVQETVDVLVPMMDALTAAHEMQIVHRDVKPENIFISFDESGAMVPKLLDFGVAKGLDEAIEGNLTRDGSVLGTPYYMAPEQARGASSVSAPADIFSLAAVAHECLAGQLPFGDRDAAEYAMELVASDVPPIRGHVPHLDEDLARAIDRALKRDAASRPQKMIEFRQQLSKAATAAGYTVPAPAVYTPEARAELLAMGEADPAETLADDTLLSDLLEGGEKRPPAPRASLGFKAMVAVLGVLAIALGFFLAGGTEDRGVPAAPATEATLLGNEPASREVPPTAVPEEAYEVDEVAADGPSAPDPEPSADRDDGEVGEEGEEGEAPVIRRIAVRRRVGRPGAGRAPRAAEESPTEAPDSRSNGQNDPNSAETTPTGMGRGDVPNVVREF